MTFMKLAKRLAKLLPVMAALVFVLADSTPASADFACFETLRRCYFTAAQQVDFWAMWAAGLDCELDFTDCVRRAISGR